MKKETGITLIALIVTIIILLILVAVSMSMILGNQGILTHAQQGANVMYEAEVNTQKGFNSLVAEMESVENTESMSIKIGDYVAYHPREENLEQYTIKGENSGWVDIENNPSVLQNQTINQEEFTWRVFSILNNRTVELIACDTEVTQNRTSIGFCGEQGYNNAVYILNDICNSLYSNEQKQAVARSINIEDVQNKIDTSKWNYQEYINEEDLENPISYGKVKHIESVIYELNEQEQGVYYPAIFSQEKTTKNKIEDILIKGNLEKSEQTQLITESYKKASNMDIEQTAWKMDEQTFQTNPFLTVETKNHIEDSTIYQELLGSSYHTNTWIASRGVNVSNIFGSSLNGIIYPAGFGIFELAVNQIDFQEMYYTNGYKTGITSNHMATIRPIVTIPIENINTQIGNGKKESPWEIL